ncbi:MAG: phage tail tape measure protein [Sinobacteraceae bacterium]|nr:phage tail tape measure protein [Nevskiaceae bacterium]
MSDRDLNLALRLYLEANGFRAGLAQSGADLRAWGQGARDEIRRADRALADLARGFAGLAAGGVLARELGRGVRASADLEDSLNAVKAILQGAHPEAKKLNEQMAAIRANSVAVAAGMKYSATEITDVTRELLQGGVPLQAILGKHGAAFSVEALAEAFGTTPSMTAEQVSKVAHAFGLGADQYGPAADLIARAQITAPGDLIELFHNLQQAGGTAGIAGEAMAHVDQMRALKETLAALKTVAPLGEEGGSNLAAVIMTMEDARLRGTKYMRALGLDFFDSKGKFIGLANAIDKLRESMAKLPTDEARLQALGLIFQAGGAKAASLLIAPDRPGQKSFGNILRAIDEQASLSQQMDVRMSGLQQQINMLRTTNLSTAATLFAPLRDWIKEGVVKPANAVSTAIGNAATSHPGIATTTSAIGAGAVALAGGAGLFYLLRALRGGAIGTLLHRVTGGLLGTAGGVAQGKALQAAAGVTPVFVVNWPGQTPFNGLPSGSVADAAATGGAAAKALRGLPAWLGRLRVLAGLSVGTLASGELGALGLGSLAGGVALAGAAGYGIGSLVYQAISGSKFADAIGRAVASALSPFSNEARAALERDRQQLDIHLRVDSDGDARISSARSRRIDVPNIWLSTGPRAAAAMP